MSDKKLRLFAALCAEQALNADGHPSDVSLKCLDAARRMEDGAILEADLACIRKRADETAWCMAWGGHWEYANDSARYTLLPNAKQAAMLSSLFAAHSLVRTTNKTWNRIRLEQQIEKLKLKFRK